MEWNKQFKKEGKNISSNERIQGNRKCALQLSAELYSRVVFKQLPLWRHRFGIRVKLIQFPLTMFQASKRPHTTGRVVVFSPVHYLSTIPHSVIYRLTSERTLQTPPPPPTNLSSFYSPLVFNTWIMYKKHVLCTFFNIQVIPGSIQ